MGLRPLDMPSKLLPWAILVLVLAVIVATVPAHSQPAASQLDGCLYQSSPGTVGNNQVTPIHCNVDKLLKVETTPASGVTTTVVGAVTAADGAALTNTLVTYSYGGLYNGTTMDLFREIVTGANTIGTGVGSVGLMAQCDDTSPQAITENRFGNLRFNCTDHSLIIGGPAVDDAAASGNPVPVGGIYNTSIPTYTAGDRTQLQSGSRGAVKVQIMGIDSTSGPTIYAANADGQSAAINTLAVGSFPLTVNGAGTWDRIRSVVNATDSTGTGIAAAGLVAQFNDVAPTAVTENQFGNVKMTATGGLLGSHVLTNGLSTENNFGCDSFAAISVTAAATTQIIALSGSTTIRVCTVVLSTSLTGSFTMMSGTGSNCGTPANSTGAIPILTATPVVIASGSGAVYRGTAGGEFCIAAVTGNVTGYVMYAQY